MSNMFNRFVIDLEKPPRTFDESDEDEREHIRCSLTDFFADL